MPFPTGSPLGAPRRPLSNLTSFLEGSGPAVAPRPSEGDEWLVPPPPRLELPVPLQAAEEAMARRFGRADLARAQVERAKLQWFEQLTTARPFPDVRSPLVN